MRNKCNKYKRKKCNAEWEAMMSEEMKVLGVRVPQAMKDWLEGQAKRNGRSLSGETLFRLRMMMEQEMPKGEQVKQA